MQRKMTMTKEGRKVTKFKTKFSDRLRGRIEKLVPTILPISSNLVEQKCIVSVWSRIRKFVIHEICHSSSSFKLFKCDMPLNNTWLSIIFILSVLGGSVTQDDLENNEDTLPVNSFTASHDNSKCGKLPKDAREIVDDLDLSCFDEKNNQGPPETNPADKYSYKNNQEWDNFRRAIETAESTYSKTRDQRLKCTKDSCSCYEFVIDKDLSKFGTGITQDLVQKAIPRGVLYQIRDGKLYRDADCKFPARCTGIEHFLLQLLKELPDMEFVINVSDYPQIPDIPFDNSRNFSIPLFSFSKTSSFADILYPAWSFWDGGPSISIFPTGLGRWDLLRKSLLKSAKGNPWDQKKSKAFFRGSRTSAERDSLILLSRSHPELVDAKYTKNQAWKSEADTLGHPPAAEVRLEDHCQYKYLFNFRGVGASFRFKHLFLCRSLVFHVGDEWEEFFYPSMKPWIHYFPVKKDSTSDQLRSLIEFGRFHDDLAQKVADRGYKFIKSNLRMTHISCYWKQLLTKYAQLIDYKIVPRNGLVQISQHRPT